MTDKIFIIAEAAQGYEGSLEKAKLLLKAAIEAKADAFKIQIFEADEIARSDYKYYPLFCDLEMPQEHWQELIAEAKRNQIKFYADVFGLKTARWLHDCKIDGYKIHCSDVSNPPLLEFLKNTGADLLLSCGGSTLEEIVRGLEWLSGGQSSVTLLTGFQGEPSPLEETHLRRIRFLREKFGKAVGLQDHIEGKRAEAFWIPLMALGAGATVIEKHITLSRVFKLEDYVSALTPDEFCDFVRMIRTVEATLGNSEMTLSGKEKDYRILMKKHVVAHTDIKPGDTLSFENLALKRTAEREIPLFPITNFIGKRALVKIQKDQILNPELVQ